MNEKDPLKVLEELEARVKKAEESAESKNKELASFENLLRETNEKLAKAEKDADFGRRFRELLAEYGHIYSAPITMPQTVQEQIESGTVVQVKEAARLVAVKDPQEPLVVETSTISGQIGQAILEKRIVPERRYRVAEIAEILHADYEGKWGKGQIQQELERLTAPPFRLFAHTEDSQGRHWFVLREAAQVRVQKE